MRAFKEDWSAESMPLQKSKEPEGDVISSITCVLCEKKVRTINGKMIDHKCITIKKRRDDAEYEDDCE
jgi:hypothetical protein